MIFVLIFKILKLFALNTFNLSKKLGWSFTYLANIIAVKIQNDS